MKRLCFNLIILAAFMIVAGCASTGGNLPKPMPRSESSDSGRIKEAKMAERFAMDLHDQGGFKKSAERFLDAAEIYHDLSLYEDERRALVAAVKVQLKANDRAGFLHTMARFKGLLEKFEMPTSDERFLVNLSDNLTGDSLTYPAQKPWNVVFEN